MKLNRFGINLDEGIPLNENSLEKLYVNCFDDTVSQITDWIKDNETKKQLLFGGQIGAGKSTLMAKIFSDNSLKPNSLKPDITLKFDREGLNLDEGDFLSIILVEFVKRAIGHELNLSFSKLPSEVFGLADEDWQGILNVLCSNIFSLKALENKISARKLITKHADYIIEVISKIGKILESHKKSPLFIFASGLDKYDPQKHTFKLSLGNSIRILSKYKTLYEVNAVHLFLPDNTSPFFSGSRKIFIQTMSSRDMMEVLEKRMGIYAEPIKEELELIAEWSGGNPRQAIRLLVHYQAARKNKKLDKAGRLAIAIKRSTDDFFAFARKPSTDLIKTVSKDHNIQTSLFYLAGDKETALGSLYGNWIFITRDSADSSWPVIINPLSKPFFESDKILSEEPEQKLLLKYAEANEMSPTGLSFDMLVNDTPGKSADELLQDFFSMGFEEPLPLNITEVFEVISAALLSKDRKDRILIGYKDKNILDAARAYLFAKANSYEYQRFEHLVLQGGKDKEPIIKLEEALNLDTDIISLDFTGQFNENQQEALDKYRDNLIDYQMLWWISLEDLREYLPNWVQLRELFEVFILEDELLVSLSIEDIESDLAFFEDLVESEESAEYSMVTNLKIVLEYLKQNRGNDNG
ncbi:hypothetical protein QUF76_05300 [Desulfobacterales bacterium HSG16]|nr:hypothetical protein [Desulfobacterales bacterium HSG16]